MILISAFKKYFALDDKQKEFIKSGQRVFLNKPDELLKFLRPLASFDKEADGARGQCGLFMGLMVVGWIIAMIIHANEVVRIPFFEVITIITAIAFIFLLGVFIILGSLDIHNNLREFVVPVINSISQDMSPDEKIRVKIDLRGKCIPAKQIKKDHYDPGWFSYPKITTTIFKDNWLDGSATLYDGSKMFFSVSDMVTEVVRKRKNPRGKIKTKTKNKIKHTIKVGLGLKQKLYHFAADGQIQAAGDKLKKKEGNKRSIVSLTRVEKSSSVDATLDPVTMLSLVGKILMSARPAAEKGKHV